MEDQSIRTAVIFSLDEEIGALAKALHVFGVSMSESISSSFRLSF